MADEKFRILADHATSQRIAGALTRRGFLGVVGVAPVGQAQVRAFVGEPSCDRLADAARRAGQQRYPARQVTGHGWTRMRIGLPS